MTTLRPYAALFSMNAKQTFSYRSKAISGVLSQIFWGFMFLMMYKAFYASGNPPTDFSMLELSTYIWLGQAFYAFSYVGNVPAITNPIIKGDVAYEFVRPIDLYFNWYFKNFAGRAVEALIRFLPIVILGFLLPAGIGLSLPVSVPAFLLFLASLILGGLMASAIFMFICIFTFKTMSPKGVAAIVMVICNLFGGAYIPLPLMPAGVRRVLEYLPFRFMGDLPYRIYMGNVSLTSALIFIAIQIAWLVTLVLIGRACLKNIIKNVEVQGG